MKAGFKTYYITTPLYYVNALPHLGSAYTTIAADILARWMRQMNKDVYFLTGTDEHGQKIMEAAEEAGLPVQDHVDKIAGQFKKTWDDLGITYDRFIRTTEEKHIKVVSHIFEKAVKKGHIYKSLYEGPYCVSCERFWPLNQIEEDKCPDCGKVVRQLKEENYFFRLSHFASKILKHFQDNKSFVLPRFRASEMTNRIEEGLQDLSVTRSSFKWGIPMPGDEEQVIYVWFDALINYITGANYLFDEEDFQSKWPADVHFIGKEINWFHSVIWPCMLMAVGLEPPKTVCAHGWLTVEGEKMSKSKGNFLDPLKLVQEFGNDQLRYYLFRDIMFGKDGDFSRQALINRVNWDLANDLGNLLHRTTAMIQQYFDSTIPPVGGEEKSFDGELMATAKESLELSVAQMEKFEFTHALESIWNLVRKTNKYIDQSEPWLLAKNEESRPRLGRVMYNLAEAQRFICTMVKPFVPQAGEKMGDYLGLNSLIQDKGLYDLGWGGPIEGIRVKRGEPLFPRIENDIVAVDGEGGKLEKKGKKSLSQGGTPAENEKKLLSQDDKLENKKEEKSGGNLSDDGSFPEDITIDIQDFSKITLKVATIKEILVVPKADRLYKLSLDAGEEKERTVVAGIREAYPEPSALIGKQVVLVSNLKPVKIKGIISHGMILAARDEKGNLSIVSPSSLMASGSKVC